MPVYTQIGRRIKAVASVPEIAGILGVHVTTVRRRLTHRGRSFTTDELETLAAGLNLPTWWFFAPVQLDREMAWELNRAMQGLRPPKSKRPRPRSRGRGRRLH
jgi:hypothetical protein